MIEARRATLLRGSTPSMFLPSEAPDSDIVTALGSNSIEPPTHAPGRS